MLCLSCGAQICLTRCVRGRGSCAHPTPSRGPAVSHCDHPLPQGSSPTPSLSRHLCPSTSVSVCEGPEAFLLHHTLVWRFHTLCARAASSCQHSDYLAPLFRVSQQLPTMNRLECNPTLEGSHMAFRLGWCHHGHHPSLRSARSPASLSKRVIRVTQERTKPKTVPQKTSHVSWASQRAPPSGTPCHTSPPTSGRTTGQTPSLLHPSHAPSDWGSTKETPCGASSVTCREQL